MVKQVLKKLYYYKKDLFCIFILICLSTLHLIFALRINQYFEVDDFTTLAFMRNNSYSDIIPGFFVDSDLYGFRRILGYVYVKAFWDVFGLNAVFYNLGNFFFHTANVILVYAIAKRLTKSALVSLFAGLFFNQLYLFYFSNVHELIVTAFSLLSIYSFFKWQERQYISLLFFVAALLVKEVAFAVPLLIFSLGFIYRFELKKLTLHFVVLVLYLAYQASFMLGDRGLPKNESYKIITNPVQLFSNLIYYIEPVKLITLMILPFAFKKAKSAAILIVAIIALSPVLLFANRQEIYYLYLPLSFISIYLAVNLPKPKLKHVPVYIVLFFLLGGRNILPKIAWQEFPNWQKISVENLMDRIGGGVAAGESDIYIGDLNLERDAKLILQYNLLDEFVDENSGKFQYEYDPQGQVVRVKSN